MADEFKTVDGKEYKNVTVSRVEADGIVLRTKTGISKIYFAELPKDVQERFHFGSAMPTGKAVTQRIDKAESAVAVDETESALRAENAKSAVVGDFADKLAQKVQQKLDEREAVLQGKHTPGPAELSVIREFNWHWVYFAVIAIVSIVLFTVVWRRFQ